MQITNPKPSPATPPAAKALKKFYGRVVKGDYVDRWFPEDDPKCPEEIKKQEKVSVGVFKRFMQQLGVTDDK